MLHIKNHEKTSIYDLLASLTSTPKYLILQLLYQREASWRSHR